MEIGEGMLVKPKCDRRFIVRYKDQIRFVAFHSLAECSSRTSENLNMTFYSSGDGKGWPVGLVLSVKYKALGAFVQVLWPDYTTKWHPYRSLEPQTRKPHEQKAKY